VGRGWKALVGWSTYRAAGPLRCRGGSRPEGCRRVPWPRVAVLRHVGSSAGEQTAGGGTRASHPTLATRPRVSSSLGCTLGVALALAPRRRNQHETSLALRRCRMLVGYCVCCLRNHRLLVGRLRGLGRHRWHAESGWLWGQRRLWRERRRGRLGRQLGWQLWLGRQRWFRGHLRLGRDRRRSRLGRHRR